MRADRPSSTASLVAFLRAIATDGATGVRDFSDPVAAQLLPSPWSGALQLFEMASRGRPWVARALWASSLGMIDLLPLRTEAIDEALAEGHAEQLVILGAGLDGRAWRLPQLADTTVFEVDHPATQGYKRARVAGLPPTAKEVRFVPVDFERDSLGAALDAAGHRTDRPTFWIWEGVIMYLHRDAMRATLDEVAERSAATSRIAATYLTRGAGQAAVGWLVRSLSEPLRGVTSPDEMNESFAAVGFRTLSDSSAMDWSERFSDRPPLTKRLVSSARLLDAERLIVGERA